MATSLPSQINSVDPSCPVALHYQLRQNIGELLLAQPETMTGPIFQALEFRFGMQIDRASQTISAEVADRRTSDLLGVPVGAPLVCYDRIVYLTNSRPAQFARCYMPAARYALHVWLKRQESDGQGGITFGSRRVMAPYKDLWDN